MQTDEHKRHIAERTSHNNCCECRADNQRYHAAYNARPWKYDHVHDYLSHIRPRLDAVRFLRNGGDSIAGRQWYRDFVKALHVRVSLKGNAFGTGRKHTDGYLDRLRMALSGNGATDMYLRQFASRGASCLDR